MRTGSIVTALLVGSLSAHAAPPAASPPAPPAAPVAAAPPAPSATPAVPQQTTATFGDWVLRCVQSAAGAAAGAASGSAFGVGAKQCEVVQVVQQDGKPVAQTAIGAVEKGRPLRLTVLVPPFVSFEAAPVLVGAGGESAGVTLAWRRCLPGGCIAEGEAGGDALPRIGGWAQPGRIVFADGAGRAAAVPVAPQGLTQALNAMSRETAP